MDLSCWVGYRHCLEVEWFIKVIESGLEGLKPYDVLHKSDH